MMSVFYYYSCLLTLLFPSGNASGNLPGSSGTRAIPQGMQLHQLRPVTAPELRTRRPCNYKTHDGRGGGTGARGDGDMEGFGDW